MALRFQTLPLVSVGLVILIGSSLAAQDEAQTSEPLAASTSDRSVKATPINTATIEKIMDQAVTNISRRYNLNADQQQKTDEILKRDVYRFLREHENEIWPLIQDLFRSGLRPPENDEDVERIGKAARPLLKLVNDAILRGNEEWRMYLTPEQRRLHDYDLAEMEKTIEQIDRNLDQWAGGHPVDESLFPAPPPPELGPPRPTKPGKGLPPPVVDVFDPRTIFDTFVEEFIKEYELNKGQRDSARSILAEYKAKADDFRNAKKQELTKLAEEMKTAFESRDRKKVAAAEMERKKLLKPVYELFGQMENRLTALLTTAQSERHGSEGKSARQAVPADEERRQTVSAKKSEPKAPIDKPEGQPKGDGDSD